MEDEDDAPHITDYHSSMVITKTTEVIETIDVTNYHVSKKKNRHSTVYDKDLCKDNKPLTDFINTCLLLDSTSGMEKVLNKVLLPAYVRADKNYKRSESFKKVITKAFNRLTNDPGRKYTHISDIVETLRIHVSSAPEPEPIVKKRVNFITISTKVSAKTNENRRKRLNDSRSSSSKVSPKKPRHEVITLDCDDDDIIPMDDEANENTSNQGEINIINGAAVNHLVNYDTIEIQDSQEVKIIDDATDEGNVSSTNDKTAIEPNNNEHTLKVHEKENLEWNENLSDENKLLVPHKERMVRLEKPKKINNKENAKKPEDMTDIEKAIRIETIEATIESCNKAIAKLDLEEVTDDSANSPYYKCDRLRATIVRLYKELCTLVGEEPSERRKIRLQIREGVPQGPIKRLEKFLNKQADKEGETPFPDFSDVVRCVEKANEKDGLGWSKAKMISEAQAIFTYCGRALQKRRQQREWKHLRAMARPEEFEADPAERDGALQARLEANRRLAKRREAEVFSKFTRMENNPEPTATTSYQIEEPSEYEDNSSDDETEPTQYLIESMQNHTESIQNPTESIQNSTESIQNPTESIQNSTESIQNPTESIQNPTECIQNPTESIQNSTASIQNPTASIQNPTESIQNPTECIQNPTESIQNSTESIQNPTESIQNPTECIQNPTKSIQNSTASIQNPTVSIQNPAECTVFKEYNNNDSINDDNNVDMDGVIKEEPKEVPIETQYQGDISLVIDISDSESDDESVLMI